MILGFDIAGTTGAAAVPLRSGRPISMKFDLNFRAGGTRKAGGDPIRRLVVLADAIKAFSDDMHAIEPIDLVVTEGYAFSRGGAGTFCAGEYGGVLRQWVGRVRLPLLVVPPQSLKSFARGEKAKFGATFDKVQMIDALGDYPPTKLDYKDDHDRADALWCAILGAFVHWRKKPLAGAASFALMKRFRTNYRMAKAAEQEISDGHV